MGLIVRMESSSCPLCDSSRFCLCALCGNGVPCTLGKGRNTCLRQEKLESADKLPRCFSGLEQILSSQNGDSHCYASSARVCEDVLAGVGLALLPAGYLLS